MLLLGLLFIAVISTVTANSYCVPVGCNTGECDCPAVFFHCDSSSDRNGVCTLTRIGYSHHLFHLTNFIRMGYVAYHNTWYSTGSYGRHIDSNCMLLLLL